MALADRIEAARQRVEARLLDPQLSRCWIYSGPFGFGDDVFDTGVGAWSPSRANATFTDVPCLIRPVSSNEATQGDREVVISGWEALIPLSVRPHEGDVLEVVHDARDFGREGQRYRITAVQAGTLAVLRVLTLEEIDRTVRGRTDA